MSINELEMKCRELRQLQALIDEAQAEAETIKDAIKAAMGTQEAVTAGEYKITWKPVTTSRLDTAALKKATAGAVYLTDKLFALADWIEQRKALPRALGGKTEKDL